MPASYSNLPSGCTQDALDRALGYDGPEEEICTCEEFALCDLCLAERHKARARVQMYGQTSATARLAWFDERNEPVMYVEDDFAIELAIDDAIYDRLVNRPCGAKTPASIPWTLSANSPTPRKGVASIGNGLYVRTGRRA